MDSPAKKSTSMNVAKIGSVIIILLVFYLVLATASLEMTSSYNSSTAYTISAGSSQYYVSQTGSDSNSGTLTSPWKTIQKAANILVAGDIVYVRGGTYRERVIAKNSGTNTNYITFVAYPGEIPVIDGTGLSFTYYDGLFETGGKSYINVDGFSFTNSPGMGIHVNPGSNYINIRNNKFKSVFAYS
ncbi:MAG: hypothetical protein QSU88_00135, partial [Candidatus Methanoperedens sp.]|nr:hypothetical protein [Candidatus Methanoperedens sp.]